MSYLPFGQKFLNPPHSQRSDERKRLESSLVQSGPTRTSRAFYRRLGITHTSGDSGPASQPSQTERFYRSDKGYLSMELIVINMACRLQHGSRMEIDQVETFLAVATFGGFHRAAEALRISQPAVSARIRALEDSLGVKLFSRSRGGLVVSDAGRTFRPHAEQLLRVAALARQAVHDAQPASGVPLQIAAALSISVYFLPDVLKRFQRAHPNVIISIRPGHSKEVLDMVLAEEAEIGLARSLQHPEVETISLRDDPLLLVAHPRRGPTHTRRAHLEKVASWPLIFYDHGSRPPSGWLNAGSACLFFHS
jgi:molybdenum-dependent DNA-binding transcriptional regulator ModE